MTRRPALATLALALAAAGAVTVAGPVPPARAAGAAAAAAAAALPPLVTLTQRARTAGRGDSAVTSPALQGLSGLARPVAAAVLRDLVNQATLLTKAATHPHVAVTVSVQLVEQDLQYLSFRFETSTYSAGAAHAASAPTTVTYRRGTGSRVGIAELFAGHVPAALAVLSTQTRSLLPTLLGPTADTEEIEAGTTPTVEDLGSVVPRVTGVEVVFAPYQVASYAEGEPSVVVPWSTLRGLTALPLPATVEPAPPYLGGLPTQLEAVTGGDVVKAVASTTNGVVRSRARGGYRLTDAVLFYGEEGRTTVTYELVRLVPSASAGAAVTLALTDRGKGLSVVDAQQGAAGCRVFPAAVRTAIRSGCRT